MQICLQGFIAFARQGLEPGGRGKQDSRPSLWISQWFLLVELCRTVALWRHVLKDGMRSKDVMRGILSTITKPHTQHGSQDKTHLKSHKYIYIFIQKVWWYDSLYDFVTNHNFWPDARGREPYIVSYRVVINWVISSGECIFYIYIGMFTYLWHNPVKIFFFCGGIKRVKQKSDITRRGEVQRNMIYPCIMCVSTWCRRQYNINILNEFNSMGNGPHHTVTSQY